MLEGEFKYTERPSTSSDFWMVLARLEAEGVVEEDDNPLELPMPLDCDPTLLKEADTRRLLPLGASGS